MNNAAENNTQKNNNGISQKDDRCCKLSVVVSVYNEEKALREFYKETNKILEQIKKSGWEHELIFVNDGSADNSLSILEEIAHEDHDVKLISFSRNFGHEAAMIAGIDYSTGDGIICMDADLQHPPECIPEIIEKFNDGYEVINMVRTQNKSAGLVKNITSSGFYWLINHISDVHFEPNASDFFAISRHVAQVLKDNYREKVRFLRGYVQNVGFKKTNIEYEARARVAGEIQNLEKQGQMLITPQTKFRMRRVKTRSESGGDDFWGTCRSIYSAVAPYVVGTLTEMGEIVVSVSEVMVGGVALIMSVLCVSDTDQFRAECAEKYRDCMDKKGPWSKEHSGGWGYTMCCARCLEFCRVQHGVWDCPRPV